MHIINAFYIRDVAVDAALVSSSKVGVNDFSDECAAVLVDYGCCEKAFCFLGFYCVSEPKSANNSENADGTVNPGL